MSQNAPAVDVVIVGGGIGGLSAALALTSKGLTTRVLEQAPEFGEVGVGLQIGPNGTRILDHWGLLEQVTALGVLPERIVMKDALDGSELTSLDLAHVASRYGAPYLVIHRSLLHGVLLQACQRAGVDLVAGSTCVAYEQADGRATAIFATGREETADLVLAAEGTRSLARQLLSDDEPVNSRYAAYRGAVPVEKVGDLQVALGEVVLYAGPRAHFVQYPLRQGEMFNQVAMFQSPSALAGEEDWGTPDELTAAFAGACAPVQAGLALMSRDSWWRMFDREPIANWVSGRVALLGDAAHPPLPYLSQGAVMAIEDAWVLAEHAAAHGAGSGRPGAGTGVDWDAALSAYAAVRVEHCRRVQTVSRQLGDLWHLEGEQAAWRNQLLRARDVRDYHFVDWLYGPTALTPDEVPPMFSPL